MTDAFENEIESLMKEKGLTSPRVTSDSIEKKIIDEAYYVFPGTATTVCCLTLDGGFNVVGSSAAISTSNFDEEIGRKIARHDAKRKIWALEGYRRKSILSNP